MNGPDDNYAARVKKLPEFFMELCSSKQTIQAMCDDGWPEPMVRRGLGMHSQTWNPNALVHAFERELQGFGGVATLDDPEGGMRLDIPETVAHIWPALPGAGVTPVLFGYLLGVRQIVRASSRGACFGRHFAEVWRRTLGPHLQLRDEGWWDADVVVISGSDETVTEVREIARERSDGRARVTGYGHRVSFAVVDDFEELDLERAARGLATDIVMWHQSGCFSCRSVVFCGGDERCEAFCEALGEAILHIEESLGAREPGEAELAERAQARGTAEFAGQVWGDGVGWVTKSDKAWDGSAPSVHAVTVHRLGSKRDLDTVIDVPPNQLQGVALATPEHRRAFWERALVRLGVTRICEPGALQRPPAGWMHDGRPNILDWLRFVDVGTARR